MILYPRIPNVEMEMDSCCVFEEQVTLGWDIEPHGHDKKEDAHKWQFKYSLF